ncbi:uncharacterized protein LOC120352496 [Nilaparvata lugens]|uniref:uncharacterized protein LOC120352496 n=1 Tax=Nilaparvata lugens TaxID=108931 RepID=UPI00193DEF9E|nr:uncharacterized protein LOC120352496 [Nilaparvata lugens]
MAQKQVERYSQSDYRDQTCAVNETAQLVNKCESHLEKERDSSKRKSISSTSKCYFCGYDKHSRHFCPAKEEMFRKSNKKGHYARMCNSYDPRLFKFDPQQLNYDHRQQIQRAQKQPF